MMMLMLRLMMMIRRRRTCFRIEIRMTQAGEDNVDN